MACHNPKGLNVSDQNCHPLLDISDDDDDDDSTYIYMSDEVNATNESDNYPFPGHDDILEAAGLTATYLRNLQRNALFHSDDASDNEEDEQIAAKENKESVAHRKMKTTIRMTL